MRQRDRNKRRRIERQDEATARQASYDALTANQKLERALARNGFAIASSATREIRRLAQDIEVGESIGGVRLA